MIKAKPDLTIDCLVHDLNNVFQTIIDAADLVSSDPGWNSIASIILRSVDQGRRIVSSIVEQEHSVVPLGQLCGNAISFAQDFAASVKGPSLEFHCDIPDGIQTGLRSTALERVLVNLFINSFQAAKQAGHRECRIRIRAHFEDGDVVTQVSDDGPGIPADILPYIFTPGFSTERSHSGLGLHIVHTLVSSGGGSVSASNGEMGGASFRLRLPAGRKVAVASHQ